MNPFIQKAAGVIAAAVLLMALAPDSAAASAEGDWEFKVDGKNAVITKYTGSDANPVTPATLGGKPVTAIASDTFAGCAIATLTLSANILEVEPGAFFECKTITDILADGGNPVYTSADGVLFRDGGAMLVQYPASNQRTRYDIPSGVVKLNTNAFDHNFFLTEITIPESVTEIGIGAFWRCQALKAIRIPAGVTAVGNSAFANCNSLQSIEVAEGNPNYMSDGFALFSKDGTHLMQCPASAKETYTVPAGVTVLDEGSFRGCILLRSVSIGDNVKKIGPCAFSYCEILESVSIGGSVESIGWGAFQGSPALKTIVLPESLKELGGQAFGECPALKAAYFQGDPPAAFDENAFAGVAQTFNVYYPEGKKKAWAKFRAFPAQPYTELPAVPTMPPTPSPTAEPTPAPTASPETSEGQKPEMPETPGTPELTSTVTAGSVQTLLRWTAVPDANYYEVYRSTAYLGQYKRVGISFMSYLAVTLPEDGKRYCYKVRAVNRSHSMLAAGEFSNVMYGSRVLLLPPS